MSALYFTGLHTVEAIKGLYRRLAMKHHPDRGGSTFTMQEVNKQYHAALKSCHGHTSFDADNREHTYTYNQAVEQMIINKIADIVSKGMIDIEIMLIGSWIWITGNTKQYRAILGKNDLQMKWHSKRSAWFWHNPEDKKRRFNNNADLDDLAAKYGCRGFKSDTRVPLPA